MRIKFFLKSGKNPKWKYYLRCYGRRLVPDTFYRNRLCGVLQQARLRDDFSYIQQRVDYYCRLDSYVDSPNDVFERICDIRMCRQKVYYFDSMEYLRWFEPYLKVSLLPGDIDYVPKKPQILKSRPVGDGNENGILLNMDKVRHFIFINDKKKFEEKRDIVQFRGKIGNPQISGYKKQRWLLLDKYWGHPMMDLGEIASREGNHNEEWLIPKLTLYEQLENKFILCIEGNDVASNLKWVMSSNSVAVMPRPTCETWFMEGTLIPNHHYIEVRPDFEDLPEKIDYYINHPDEALEIINNAHEYISQFRDKKREDIISLMTLDKYINIINK